MTGEVLHKTVLPVLPDTEDDFICVNYDGGCLRAA